MYQKKVSYINTLRTVAHKKEIKNTDIRKHMLAHIRCYEFKHFKKIKNLLKKLTYLSFYPDTDHMVKWV